MTENKRSKNCMGRRDALKLGAASLAATAAGLQPTVARGESSNSTPPLPVSGSGPGHVVKIHMPGMRVGIHPHPDASRTMVDRALKELTGEPDTRQAWLRFIKPTETVGIKINCLGTRMVSSQKEVVYAIVDSLVDAGVPKTNIVIFDMFASNMMGGRYDQQPNPRKVRVLAHNESTYYNKTFRAGPAVARFSNIFMECDSIINVPPIKDHDLVGVTCCMKNVTFGCVEKPHVNHAQCNEAIAHLWALEEIRGRVKLHIIDGSTILYDGGPKINRKALVPHEALYITTDPVAMDAIAFELIEALRAENGLRTLAQVRRPAHFLGMAEKLALGIADRKRINLQTIDLPRFTGQSA